MAKVGGEGGWSFKPEIKGDAGSQKNIFSPFGP